MTNLLRQLQVAALLSFPIWGHQLCANTQRFYTTTEGLPSSRITNICFDKQDYLWISSEVGLTRFDGEDFVTYQAEKSSENHLQDNHINTLVVADDGSHWVGASDGLYYLCRAKNKFTHYLLDETRPDISVSSIVNHPWLDHTLIIGTYGWGIHVFNTLTRTVDNELTVMLQNVTTNATFLHVDSQKRLWATGNQWLSVIDLKEKKSIEVQTSLSPEQQARLHIKSMAEDVAHQKLYLADMNRGIYVADLQHLTLSQLNVDVQNVNTLAMTNDGYLIIGTEGKGLWSYYPQDKSLRRLTASGAVNLDRAKVQNMALDSHGNLWLGIFQRGVMMLPGPQQAFSWQAIAESPDDSRNLACVADFAALPNGDRAYALDGAGVMILHRDGTRSLYDTRNHSLTSDAALALYVMDDGSLLASTYRQGVFRITPDGKCGRMPGMEELNDKSVIDFALDKKRQVLYMGTNGNGLYSFDLKSGTTQSHKVSTDGVNWIGAIYITSDEHLWLGTANHPRFLDLNTGELCQPTMPTTVVTTTGFVEDSSNRLWMSSQSGLMRYDPEQNALVQMPEDDRAQLPSYNAILRSDGDKIWLAASNEVTLFDLKNQRHMHYRDADISTVGTPSPRAAIQWPDGSFSFGGDGGVLNFRPEIVLDTKQQLPPICLKRLWVDNIPTDYDPDCGTENMLDSALWCANSLTLPAGHQSFSVSYSMLDYAITPGLHYSHRLKGFEDEWHDGYDRTATYPSVPAGKYTLQIRVQQEGIGDQHDVVTRELQVIVQPHWWATWWARLLWLALAAGIAYIIIRLLHQRKQAHRAMLEAERQQSMKEEKFDLLISVSHEIKTPLTLIISPLRKLLHRKTDPATHSVIEAIYRNSLRILMLVNEQLDVRKLDQGQLHLHVRELPLRSFLDDMMQYFRNTALSRHLSYTLTLPQNQDDMTLWADPHQLDKVMLNLLSNAIKYVGDNGDIRVTVSYCQMPNGEKGIRTTVFNSDSQLPEEHQPKAFESIGLKLALDLVRLHHGELSVRNLPEGVAFDVDLPMGNSHYTEAELANEEPIITETSYNESEENYSEDKIEDFVASTTSVSEDIKDRELVEQLNDELRETQRMRERRSSLSFDYQQMQMSSGDEKLLHRVVDVIHKNMSDPDLSVETLSQEVGISRVHLNRKLKELIDTSPSALIKSVRLKQAAFLLAQSNVTVAEVAYTVGFSSPAYFSSNFSQYFGMTPKEFTNAYTENPDSDELKQLLQ